MQHESEEDKTVIEESGSKTGDVAVEEDIRFNPNVFTEFKLAGSPEVILSM